MMEFWRHAVRLAACWRSHVASSNQSERSFCLCGSAWSRCIAGVNRVSIKNTIFDKIMIMNTDVLQLKMVYLGFVAWPCVYDLHVHLIFNLNVDFFINFRYE